VTPGPADLRQVKAAGEALFDVADWERTSTFMTFTQYAPLKTQGRCYTFDQPWRLRSLFKALIVQFRDL
jgi:hypothetical protein